ncbi:hypothetical protein F6X40_10500 [Paraburkholderia sp. UCT31]|uniref:S26 family signal peptidase n=1 Tax=Paraburkholderia sp. UCT31 TaxID=2615209 RepID=UPI001655617C|nr:S26 family signal peptidase [Paraburkholderia sp. UCT31]MBC8737237.1 hypothetical protein [Paraburkholderia sp. UCT31]
MKFKLWPVTLALTLITAVYGFDVVPWRLAVNRTESLPLGLYFANRNVSNIGKGQLICFVYREPNWARGRYLPSGSHICKEVLGVPGDIITARGLSLFAQHGAETTYLGDMREADSAGRPVPLPNWSHVVIPPGSYYLGSTRSPKSFDSRYLGLVTTTEIAERIYPLIVF